MLEVISMSFIDDYLLTTKDSQPAIEYHIWSMLSTLSTFAGRRFWLPFGPMNYFPNLYVMLVGEPGNGKSTAMNRAKNIVRAAQICPVAATKVTKEALSLTMSSEKFPGKKFFEWEGEKREYNQYAIFATEFTQFISVDPLGWLDFLTTIWDEPIYEAETKNKGNDYIYGPYITLCACMTPEIVKGFLKQNLLTGGFSRRCAFVFANYKNIVNIPSFSDEQKAAEDRCIEFGKRLQSRFGKFSWTPELQDYYCAWNQENEKVIRDRAPTVRGWFQSKGEMLFKISMLVALAEEGELVIDIPHYKIAQRFCELLEKNLERVFEGAGINPNAGAASQICNMLESLGRPMNIKHLKAMFFGQVTSLNDLTDTLTHLISVGRLEERVLQENGQILGTIVGTPGVLAKYSDVELRVFLGRQTAPSSDQTP